MSKGKLLHLLLAGRDNNAQVPDLLTLPDDRDVERAKREGGRERLREVRRRNCTALRNPQLRSSPILEVLVPLSNDATVDRELLH